MRIYMVTTVTQAKLHVGSTFSYLWSRLAHLLELGQFQTNAHARRVACHKQSRAQCHMDEWIIFEFVKNQQNEKEKEEEAAEKKIMSEWKMGAISVHHFSKFTFCFEIGLDLWTQIAIYTDLVPRGAMLAKFPLWIFGLKYWAVLVGCGGIDDND